MLVGESAAHFAVYFFTFNIYVTKIEGTSMAGQEARGTSMGPEVRAAIERRKGPAEVRPAIERRGRGMSDV